MDEEWPIGEVFDEDYLHFYAAHLNDEDSDREAALIWDLLHLEPGLEVLDLACGHGRIANRLAARGARVTGLDDTPLFLDMARADAAQQGVEVVYVLGDMRALPWSDRFDVVVSWFTAYGYFDDTQNRAVLSEIHRALRPCGRFLVELNHKDGLLPRWLPAGVTETDEGFMLDQMTYDPVTGRSTTKRTITRNGTIRRTSYSLRMFSFTELRDWLLQAGFTTVSGYNRAGGPLTAADRRMILVAAKQDPG